MKLNSRLLSSRIVLLIVSLALGLVVMFAVTSRMFDGSLDTMKDTPDYTSVLLVNGLIAGSVVLFVLELRMDAVRVVLTVIVALLFGYLVTAIFNLDSAQRFTRGEFKVSLASDAAVPDVEDMDIQYGRARAGDFNNDDQPEPLEEDRYRFAGSEGDEITILAFAARANVEVDLQVALLDADGNELAKSTEVTQEQIDAYKPDLKSTKDAAITNYTLPADGLYTIHVKPEDLSQSQIIKEMLSKTRVAYEAFLLGPVDRVLRWSFWIQDALTLILLGLSIAIVFRAEQFSLGAEGQLYFGALVSGVIVLSFGDVPKTLLVPIALLSAGTAGFLWGLLPGALKAYLGANELVSTLMLNTIATRFYEMVLTFQLQPPDAGYTASDWFPSSGQLTPIVEGTQVTIAVYVVIAVVILTWLLIRRTPIGYEIRMIGANIKFADYGGINTKRTIMLAMAISGIVAGLAGAHLGMGIHRKLILNISIGLAFEGVVVALLARNNPLVVPFAGLLYAYLRTGARFMESDANVSFEVVRIIQSIIILLITAQALVTIFRRRRIRRRGTLDLDLEAGANGGLPPSLPAEEGAHV
ncbi:MAG: ABC transporter permease [Anaerolineae bacterium]|nr:ABC transporter permease [Anaerolineae bacterium]